LHDICTLGQPRFVAERDGDGAHVFDVDLRILLGVPDRLVTISILLLVRIAGVSNSGFIYTLGPFGRDVLRTG
jgi:hypothetical protein